MFALKEIVLGAVTHNDSRGCGCGCGPLSITTTKTFVYTQWIVVVEEWT